MKKNISIIGSGFSSLSAACYLAKAGHNVTVYEKNEKLGGRARQFKDKGFTFDMGPSWYWMPDVFEDFYNKFGKKTEDLYDLVRLKPSYKVFYENDEYNIPAGLDKLESFFESIEKGAGKAFKEFMADAKIKYDIGMKEVVFKPSLSPLEYLDLKLIKQSLKLDLLTSFKKFVSKRFNNPKIKQLLEFPVLFLGAKPDEIPALYSMMNYADSALGTWYPMGGMSQIAKAFERIALEQGVKIKYETDVSGFESKKHKLTTIKTNYGDFSDFDAVLSSMDYHHTDMLLNSKRNYNEQYWDKKRLSPSSLLFYIGVNKKVDNLLHHNLFFDTDFDQHSTEIYDEPKWPKEPLFYVCCPSKTDKSVAPENCENLFVLIPISPDLKDTKEVHDNYFDTVIDRIEKRTGVSIKEHITYRKNFGVCDFKKEYNAYKGNAYGLANTLTQTAFLKPKMKNKNLDNLYYAGQLTVPGPGLPPSIISGEVAAKLILDEA